MIIEAMHFYGTFGLSELCPGEYGQTQVNDGCVDSIEGVLAPECVLRSKTSASHEKMIKHVLENSVIPFCIGIGEGASVYSPKPRW